MHYFLTFSSTLAMFDDGATINFPFQVRAAERWIVGSAGRQEQRQMDEAVRL